MADNIVASMFGLNPYQIQQQRMQEAQKQAFATAQLDPFQRASYSLQMGGAGLAQAGAGMLGLVDPAQQAAQQQQQAMQGADTSTPEGLRALAVKLNNMGMYQQSYAAAKAADDMEQTKAETRYKNVQASDIPAMRKEQIQNARDMAVANLQIKADALKQSADQAELNRQQKAELQKQHDEVMLEIARLKSGSKSDKEQQKLDAQEGLKGTLDSMEQAYLELDKKGAIVNPEKSGLSNISARISSSALGQAIGGTFGTEEQALRNQIRGSIPLLILDIKNATGASAQQMNSNIELQNFMRAASDPSSDIKSNLQLLKNLRKKYVKDTNTESQPTISSAPKKWNPTSGRWE